MKRLEMYIQKGTKRLRMGYTTGSCAAAASGAAAELLLSGMSRGMYALELPGGVTLELEIESSHREEAWAECAVRKDAGDDPDITDGILVFARVFLSARDIEIDGGEGVGRITGPGLSRPAGCAAINPGPMSMIRRELESVSATCGYNGGLRAVISVPEGRELAKKTFNPRLGIVDGISILGSTGLVEPMSETALTETIRLEIQSKRASGETTLLLAPGNYGRDFAMREFGIGLDGAVKCSNFIGEALDAARASGFKAVILLGHAGKLVKLAAGVFNTHSSVADARMETLAAHLAASGGNSAWVKQILRCRTVDEADSLLCGWNLADTVWDSVGDALADRLQLRLGEGISAAFAVFCARGVVMRSGNIKELLPQNHE